MDSETGYDQSNNRPDFPKPQGLGLGHCRAASFAPGISVHPILTSSGDLQAADVDDELPLIMPRSNSEPRSTSNSQTIAHSLFRARRRESIDVAPEALMEMHKLNEDKVRQLKRKSMFFKEDASERERDAVWGRHDSWQLFPVTPTRSEEPMNLRRMQISPHNGECAKALMQRWGIAAFNIKGCKSTGDTTVGQDNLSLSRLYGGWEALCIMDGHGKSGDWPSRCAVRWLPYYLQDASCTKMLRNWQVEAALRFAFDKVQTDLVALAPTANVDLRFAGCTALCALRHPARKSVWIATVGDTRAALLVPGESVMYETKDHKPSVEAEERRVEAAGGEVRRVEHDEGFIEERIYVRDQIYPGICMTRSLGDTIVKDCGVIAEPEVVEWSLDKLQGALLLAASDGIWEFMSTHEAAELIMTALAQGSSMEAALCGLCEKAKELWRENEGDYCDDITAVLVPMFGETAPKMLASTLTAGQCGSGLYECTHAARKQCILQ